MLGEAITKFYLYDEAIEDMKKIISSNIFSKDKDLIALQEIQEEYKQYSEKLAKIFYIYLSTVAFGELRHCKLQSDFCINDSNPLLRNLFTITSQGDKSRQLVYEEAHRRFDPFQYMPIIENLFRYFFWTSNFGGKKWAGICNAANLYKKIPNEIFIDHVVDLHHNSGTVFDKPYMNLTSGLSISSILHSKSLYGIVPTTKSQYANNYIFCTDLITPLKKFSRILYKSEKNDYKSLFREAQNKDYFLRHKSFNQQLDHFFDAYAYISTRPLKPTKLLSITYKDIIPTSYIASLTLAQLRSNAIPTANQFKISNFIEVIQFDRKYFFETQTVRTNYIFPYPFNEINHKLYQFTNSYPRKVG